MAAPPEEPPSRPASRLLAWGAAVLAVFALALAIYTPSLGNGFSIDDHWITENHEQTSRGIEAIPEILTTNYMYQGTQGAAYRPLPRIAFALEHEWFDDDPGPGHVANLVLHCLAALAVFGLVRLLFPEAGLLVPLATALLFVAHPVHTEVVASLKNRDELMASLFGILACTAFVGWNRRGRSRSLALGAGLLGLALLSKESAHQFLGLVPLAMIFDRVPNPRRIGLAAVAMAATTAAFWFYVLNFLDQPHALFVAQSTEKGAHTFAEHPLLFIDDFGTRLGTALYALGYYLRLMVFPWPLSFFYGFGAIPLVGLTSPVALLSGVLYTAMAGWAFLATGRRLIGGAATAAGPASPDIAAFAVLFYLGGLATFANLAVPVHGILAERHVYTATSGFCLVAAWAAFGPAASRGATARRAGPLVLGAFLVAFALRAADRSMDWVDHRTLAEADVAKFPDSGIIHAMLAKIEFADAEKSSDAAGRAAHYAAALGHLDRMAEIAPVYRARVAYTRAMFALQVDRDPERALGYLDEVARTLQARAPDAPSDHTRYIHPARVELLRAQVLAELGRDGDTRAALERAAAAWNEGGGETIPEEEVATASDNGLRSRLLGLLGPED
jgi:hypothetical protein